MRIQLIFPCFFLIPICSILLNYNTLFVFSQCLEDQKSLLLQLKNSLIFNSSKSKKLVTWDQTVDCCSWKGVNCEKNGSDSGRVIGLDLSNEFISVDVNGSIDGLFDLEFLLSLNLANNSFVDVEISPGFGKLGNLNYLNMSNAGFSGQVPIELSYLNKLVILDLSVLGLLGKLPLKLESPNLEKLVRNMSSLEELYLGGVNISASGYEWCRALSSSLPNLRVLSLTGCGLSGPFDSSLAKLRYLSVIRLDNNNLSSQVPEFFTEFENLTVLSFSSSGLIGTFPAKIFKVPTLEVIDLSLNGLLEGSLPDFFPQNGSLKTLVVAMTKFSGILPESIGNLKNLSRIELKSCNFSGSIPSSMENLTQLVTLDFSLNRFTGPIPSFRSSQNLSHVIFSRNNLMGEIPSYNWEGLQNLVTFDLRFNSLSGSIPMSLFSLPLLEKILLSDNKFDGRFNEFPNASSRDHLDTLDLSSNKLEGQIPKSVFELKGLNILSLSYNNFNGTVDPNMIQNLKNLTNLDLSFNNLVLSMDSDNHDLSSLPQLATLKLASCHLTVFPLLTNQSELRTLDLSNNHIHGKIPSWVWTIGKGLIRQLNLSNNMFVGFENPLLNYTTNLTMLDLHNNSLQGAIPILSPSPTFVDFSNNNFSSFLPDKIGYNMNFTYYFSVSSNHLTGAIPKSLCNAAFLRVLDLSSNMLNGEIPSCLFQMSALGVLNLQGNEVSGSIPDSFTSKCNLQTLDLNGNRLDGLMPRTLANCTDLEVLNIGNNEINDTFPCWLKNASNLRVLVLRSNRFHGSIKCEDIVSNLEKLQIVDLASNYFSGELPPKCFKSWKAMMADVAVDHLQFEYLRLSHLYYQDAVTVTFKGIELELVKILTVFTSIDFSRNAFDGFIPDVIGELQSLYVLNLSYNAFTGQIPTSLANLTQLGSLDLSQNKLTGNIPTGLTNLYFLSFLNLSYNQLVGMIPKGSQFDTFTNNSFLGNIGLCGFPLTKLICTNTNETYINMELTPVIEFHWQYIITGIGFGVGAGIILAPLLVWKSWRNWYDKKVDAILSKMFSFMGLIYNNYGYDYGWDETGEATAATITTTELTDNELTNTELTNTELTDITRYFYDENEVEDYSKEDGALRGMYCVFCSKLDISRKKAIHNHNCTCLSSMPLPIVIPYSSL